MNDALEIANLKARYCAASDKAPHDAEAARADFMALFTDDFTGDYGFGQFESAAALADFMCSAVAGGSEWMIHLIGSADIRIEGDAAVADWAVFARMKRREGGEIDNIQGRYHDRFRRTADGWRIASIRFERFS